MEIDLVTAVHLAGLALNAEALRRLHAAGHPEVRESHGFVLQHVVEGPRPIGEIAGRMGVTQQAASKAVAELERLGYLERTADPRDARVRLVRLAARGGALVEDTRRIRAEMEEELAAALEWAGGGEAVRTRRVRAPS